MQQAPNPSVCWHIDKQFLNVAYLYICLLYTSSTPRKSYYSFPIRIYQISHWCAICSLIHKLMKRQHKLTELHTVSTQRSSPYCPIHFRITMSAIQRTSKLIHLSKIEIRLFLNNSLREKIQAKQQMCIRDRTMTLKDIVDFQKEWVKGRTYVYCILGDKKDLDMNKLKAVGPIEELTQEQIFGY